MIVVIDNMMTASGRFADILLPATSSFEESDLCYQSYGMELGVLIMRQKAIKPLGECRTLFDICAQVAKRMGVAEEFTGGRSNDQWVEHMYHQCRKVKPELPEDYRDALETGLFKWARPYSAPQFDEALGQMTKCDFFREELEQEGVPTCVAGCPTRALQFGEYDQLAARHGSDLLMAPLPPPVLTEPNFILVPHRDAKPGQTGTGAICNPEEVKDA